MSKIVEDIENSFAEAAVIEYLHSKNPTFGGALYRVLDWKGMSVKELSEKCYLSTAQIHRYMQDEIRFIKVEPVIAFCVAMNLSPKISMSLVELAEKRYLVTQSHLSRIYQFIIKHAPEWTLDDANEYVDTLNDYCGVEGSMSHFPNEKSYERHLKKIGGNKDE